MLSEYTIEFCSALMKNEIMKYGSKWIELEEKTLWSDVIQV